LLWLLKHVHVRGLRYDAALSGSRVVRLKLGKAVFCDSAALFRMSLADLTATCGVQKEKLGLACRGLLSCDPDCKGYCWIHPRSPRLKRIAEYCAQDCRSLEAACRVMEAFAREHRINLGITIGSSAFRTAKDWLELEPPTMEFAEHRRIRRALYAGRCQVLRPMGPATKLYDVNSMYPWALAATSLPVGGSPNWTAGDDARREWRKERPGYYCARVTVPDCWIPPLPAKTRSGRNAYPVGTWEGWFAQPELAYAESLGVELKVLEAASWPRAEPLFKPWAEKLYELRHAQGKSTPKGKWLKGILNSAVGKLAARTEKEHVDGFLEGNEVRACRLTGACPRCRLCLPRCRDHAPDCGGCCRHHCSGRCGAHVELGSGVHVRRFFRIEACSRPEWAGYVWAASRIRLHRLWTEGGGEDACYGDTDSVFTSKSRSGVGEGLGELEVERVRSFHARAPKLYGYEKWDGKEGKWKQVYRAKGFPAPDGKALEGGLVKRPRLRGYKSSARLSAFFTVAENGKEAKVGYGDRFLDGKVTRAPDAQEAGVIGAS
jgi:hypothetical protein